MVSAIGGLLGSVVWLLANVKYRDYLRFREKSFFRRVLAYWIGFPGTLFSQMFARPRPVTAPQIGSGPDDEEELLEAIREDRLRRIGGPAAQSTLGEVSDDDSGR